MAPTLTDPVAQLERNVERLLIQLLRLTPSQRQARYGELQHRLQELELLMDTLRDENGWLLIPSCQQLDDCRDLLAEVEHQLPTPQF